MCEVAIRRLYNAPTDLHITALNGEILFYTLANILPIRRFKIIERARHYENKHSKTGEKKKKMVINRFQGNADSLHGNVESPFYHQQTV